MVQPSASMMAHGARCERSLLAMYVGVDMEVSIASVLESKKVAEVVMGRAVQLESTAVV